MTRSGAVTRLALNGAHPGYEVNVLPVRIVPEAGDVAREALMILPFLAAQRLVGAGVFRLLPNLDIPGMTRRTPRDAGIAVAALSVGGDRPGDGIVDADLQLGDPSGRLALRRHRVPERGRKDPDEIVGGRAGHFLRSVFPERPFHLSQFGGTRIGLPLHGSRLARDVLDPVVVLVDS